MKTITITLGGQEVRINELPSAPSSRWRKELVSTVEPLLSLVEQAGRGVEISDSQDLMRVVRMVVPIITDSPDSIASLLSSYTGIEIDLDSVYDSEIIEAFTQVLALAYPFTSLGKLQSLASGSPTKPSMQTSKNSLSQNGEI